MGATYLMEGPLLRVLWDETTRMIRVEWTEANAAMTDDDLKRALGWIADHVAERKAQGLLIDVRDFRHDVSTEVQQWKVRHISPRYNAASLERLAFLFPSHVDIPSMASQPAAGDRFVTRGFNRRSRRPPG